AARRDKSSEERAAATWRGLVSARWTLVDSFANNGERFVVARRNDLAVGGLGALSERERQVIAHAALGRSNKVIAYELGLADSTVRVLIRRAAQKLGARGRAEAIAKFTRR